MSRQSIDDTDYNDSSHNKKDKTGTDDMNADEMGTEDMGTEQKPKKRSKVFRIFLFFVVIGFGFVSGLSYDAIRFLKTPANTEPTEVRVQILPGQSGRQISQTLEDNGVVVSAWRFRILVKAEGAAGKIRAGEFIFNTGKTPLEILAQLTTAGSAATATVTIREGLPWWQVEDLLVEQGIVDRAAFQKIVTDAEFLAKNKIPFSTAEGFLYPDTYEVYVRVPTPANTEAFVQRMVDNFWNKNKDLLDKETISASALKEYVIIASIVEKETGVGIERARVAGVYLNRIRIKMPLQADPTTIYGLGRSFDGNLRRVHLNDAVNLYNTYKHNGLPPGPICSPSALGIKAVLEPEIHKFLYFVSRNDGTHKFSETLGEHNRAVREFQLGSR